MAKKRKPENETPEERDVRLKLESISNQSNKSEKVSWNRKMDNMVKLIAKLRPIEEQILELTVQKQPIFDEIQELRNIMIQECIHPYENLVLHDDDTIECKFCLSKSVIVNKKDK